MKLHTRQLLFATVAAALIAPAALAAPRGADAGHSQRIIRGTNFRNTGSTEADYESRMSRMPWVALQHAARQLGRGNLAIASFGTSEAASNADPLILYWNFNDSGVANGQPASAAALQSDVTAVPPPTQTSTIDTTGFSGPTVAAGTTLNLAPGDVSGAGQSLSFSAASANNGKFITFAFSGTALQDLILTQAVRSTTTGFGGITLYSTDGTNFTPFGTQPITRDANFQTLTFDLSAINSLDNQATITFKETFNTVTGSTGGGTQLDNIQLNATAVPEPSTYFGAALALVALGWMQRRRLLGLIRIA